MPVIALKRKTFFRNPKAKVAVSRQPVQSTMSQHRHEFFEIAIILSGHGVHITGEFRHIIETGDVLVINRRRTHGYESNDNLNLVNILIGEEMIAQLNRKLREVSAFHALFSLESLRWQRKEYQSRLRLDSVQLRQAGEWVDCLERELQQGDAVNLFAAEAYLTLIVNLLVRNYEQGRPVVARPDDQLGRLLGWLEQNCAEPLTVGRMAKQAGMSERHFFRVFSRAVGQSPLAYLNRARIRRATDLMAGGGEKMRIAEVATACGFGDSNYFSRSFRQITGRTPREFVRGRNERIRL
jgi:AraC-like DNA-binding protein